MPALEQHQPTDKSQPPCPPPVGLHDARQAAWGIGAEKPVQAQSSTALQGFGDFCIGFTDGLGHFVTETTQAAGKAITHPKETIHNAVEGTRTAVESTGKAIAVGSSYIADKVSHGDYAGMTKDAVHTGEAIGSVVQSVDHFNHLSAKEKGYIVGHDVAPTVIGTIVAPELIPEGAIAAGATKVASAVGTLVKEEGIAARVATTFESAREKLQSISDKVAALNKKMEGLTNPKGLVKCVEEHEKEGFEHINPIKTPGKEASEKFVAEVKAAHEKLDEWVVKHLEKENLKTFVVEKTQDVFGDRYSRIPACFNPNNELAPKGIYIAEKVWNRGEWQPNNDVMFRLQHEIGHAINATFKTDFLSNEPAFVKAFAKDWKAISMEEPTAQILASKADELRRDEVFADLFAHLKFESNSNYSNNIRRLFPNTMEHMIERNGKW